MEKRPPFGMVRAIAARFENRGRDKDDRVSRTAKRLVQVLSGKDMSAYTAIRDSLSRLVENQLSNAAVNAGFTYGQFSKMKSMGVIRWNVVRNDLADTTHITIQIGTRRATTSITDPIDLSMGSTYMYKSTIQNLILQLGFTTSLVYEKLEGRFPKKVLEELSEVSLEKDVSMDTEYYLMHFRSANSLIRLKRNDLFHENLPAYVALFHDIEGRHEFNARG